MNKIDKNLLILFCKYIGETKLNSFRQCSIYLSKIVGNMYFTSKTITASGINKYNKNTFYNFVDKYELLISVNKVNEVNFEFLLTLNLKALIFNNFNKPI